MVKRVVTRTKIALYPGALPGAAGAPLLVLLLFLLLVLVRVGSAAGEADSEASIPPDYQPPGAQQLCGALTLDYELCDDDPQSGNCAGFVDAADRLGEIYRSELRAHPGWITDLRTTLWWGCGNANLEELRSLLARVDSAQAGAVLAQEPYRSLAPAPAAAPVARPAAPEEPDCITGATPEARSACAARALAEAKAAHAAAYDACRQRVGPAFRETLASGEQSFERMLPLECTGVDFTRDECLANAYRERTRTMLSTHRECRSPGGS